MCQNVIRTGSSAESKASTGHVAKSGAAGGVVATPPTPAKPLGLSPGGGATSWIVVGSPLVVAGAAAHGSTRQIVVGGPPGLGAELVVTPTVVVVPSLPAWRMDWPDAQAASVTQAPMARRSCRSTGGT